jgi:hypothetical protein
MTELKENIKKKEERTKINIYHKHICMERNVEVK